MSASALRRPQVPPSGGRALRRVDSGLALPGEGRLEVAVEIFLPDAAAFPALSFALVCLPGGGMNRRYYDLMAGADDSFSFARQMARRGFAVLTVDHLGVGDSTRPADGYALTPKLLAQANARAVERVVAELRAGSRIDGLAPLPGLRTIGVGHSMGALLTVVQQARTRQHAALALLGFATRGLPEYLPAQARTGDAATLRAQAVDLARAMFGAPYPRIPRGSGSRELYGSAAADPRGVEAIKQAADVLLPVPSLVAMLPGNAAAEAAEIEAPVFIGVGERDMVGDPAAIPASFPRSRAASLHVLRETGHSHFLFPARAELFDRLAGWADSLSRD
ncbi:MAG: alpha/beta fold hydrolase [Gammaproteobacteria bacterium]|nr:alpha/beta fold hydrolase [Gammaproteobacteria bacterium]